ncbi:hypothetical protein FA95DRAFT_1591684 [Auriscalpium vulgare]|uniref:Uncharacterized protein n=1 Tax=Auriscalpium vulgare TaxID=40419 RepID=A0ACB8SC87_9AGAM|nr:hypothetical protein FA95DRAFT_1591684 [Auriscalpium vulgare]
MLDDEFFKRAVLSAKTSIDLIFLALAARSEVKGKNTHSSTATLAEALAKAVDSDDEDEAEPSSGAARADSPSRGSKPHLPIAVAMELFRTQNMREFNRVLFVEEHETEAHHQTMFFAHMKMWDDQGMPVQAQLLLLTYIVEFLEYAKRHPSPMPAFYTWLQRTRRDVPVTWPHHEAPTSTKYLWEIIASILGFHGSIKFNDEENVHAIVQRIFPSPSNSRSSPGSFQVTFRDLLSVKFDLRPTHFLHEHLMVEGNIVKFYYLTAIQATTLRTYGGNKIARALDLDTIGDEILASWASLLGDRTIEPEMRKRRLLEEGENVMILYTTTLAASNNIRPHHFADREANLLSLIAWRRRWWNVLLRDVRDQRDEQPFMFYGAILAVFFGVCTVIQTVTAVWGLVLAARA